MPKDTPTGNPSVRERGTFAKHGDDPTLASYLSSLFFVLSVPTFVLIAYGGYRYDLYPYETIVPVFGGLLVAGITAAFTLMHVLTR